MPRVPFKPGNPGRRVGAKDKAPRLSSMKRIQKAGEASAEELLKIGVPRIPGVLKRLADIAESEDSNEQQATAAASAFLRIVCPPLSPRTFVSAPGLTQIPLPQRLESIADALAEGVIDTQSAMALTATTKAALEVRYLTPLLRLLAEVRSGRMQIADAMMKFAELTDGVKLVEEKNDG